MSNIHKMNGASQPQNTMHLTPEDVTKIECKHCGCELFESKTKLFEMSSFHPKNSTGRPITIPQPTLICNDCGREYKPEA